MRDEGALDAALARPQHVYAYEPKADLARLAAAYGFGLVRVNDGNKRAGFLAIGLFLALNGSELVADQVGAVKTVFKLASGELQESDLTAWIGENSTRSR